MVLVRSTVAVSVVAVVVIAVVVIIVVVVAVVLKRPWMKSRSSNRERQVVTSVLIDGLFPCRFPLSFIVCFLSKFRRAEFFTRKLGNMAKYQIPEYIDAGVAATWHICYSLEVRNVKRKHRMINIATEYINTPAQTE